MATLGLYSLRESKYIYIYNVYIYTTSSVETPLFSWIVLFRGRGICMRDVVLSENLPLYESTPCM